MKRILSTLIFAELILVPVSVSAQILNNVDDLKNLIIKLTGWAFLLLASAAVVIIIWAAFEFVTSEGNPDKVSEAKNRATFAIIALVLAILARGLVNLMKSFFGI